SVAFSPDGKKLVCGADRVEHQLKCWDVATGKELWQVEGRRATFSLATVVAFSPDGKVVASGGGHPLGGGSQIQFWKANSGQLLRRCAGTPSVVGAMVFSRDGKSLVSAGSSTSGRRLTQWDVDTAKIVREFAAPPDWLHALDLSSDGKLLA